VTRKGSIVGIPRDSWVNIPGYGTRKINSALALGGPDLLVRTIRDLTGLPISYYAITAFDGIVKIVDTLHGVDINVPYRMNDSFSGARFEPGWHHMDGRQVLAFSRDRHDVPGGDFGRSENQGRVILAALAKLRHETSDESGIRRWLGVLFSYGWLDMPMTDAVKLGVLARQIDPSGMYDVVAPGTTESRGGQSVVILSDGAYALFRDVGADALADGKIHRATPPPTPKPKPTATPVPTTVPVPTTTPGVTLPPV
jgi:LCP family protein required for cell wall assembly